MLRNQTLQEAGQDLTGELDSKGYLFFPEVEEGFDHLAFLRRFGTVRPQYDGKDVWRIEPDRRFDGIYHSLNTEPLFPHTEYYEREGIPHRYQALWCVAPAECGGGQTLLADGYAFLDALDGDERRYLLTQRYEFGSSAGIRDSGLGSSAAHPVVEVLPGGTRLLRFSYNCMRYEHDHVMRGIAERVLEFFEAHRIPITYRRNSLLVWDNFRMLHSRTGFKDRQRKLERVFLDPEVQH
ncbi:Gamma-butyrobetaine dioxygenase [Candidatus Sulfopaludibacter sp. SbA4]|nr:Gamma-butyrobetaine dioxygenase [Candidatus Sulfopaludibacter sp. SbA4]